MAIRNDGKSRSVGLRKNSGGHSAGPRLGLAVIWILLDQLTRIIVLKTSTYGESRPVIGFLNLMLVYNKRVTFSFPATAGGWQRWSSTRLGMAAAPLIMWLLKRHSERKMFCFALALILDDALGSTIDCVIYSHVADFPDFYLHDYHWSAFNVVDYSITIGAVLLIVGGLWRVRR